MSHLAFFLCALCFSQVFTLQYAHSLTFLTSLVLVPQLAPTMALSFVLSQPTTIEQKRPSVSHTPLTFPIPTPEPRVLSLLTSTVTRSLRFVSTPSYTLATRSPTPAVSRSPSSSRTPSRTLSRTPSRSPLCVDIRDSYNYLIQDRCIPITLNPPKPNLPNSQELFDGVNRTLSNNPATYPEFERIVRPLNTMNTFLKSYDLDCANYVIAVLNKWAVKQALTGRVNSYGVLLHRVTSGNMALAALNTYIYANQAIKNWHKTLLAAIVRYPEPYDNNFRMWEYRAIAALSYASYTPFRQLQTQLNTFLDMYVDNGILMCELRGMRSVDYHSYFLSPLMETMYMLRSEYGFAPPQASAIEGVIQMLESKNYTSLEKLTKKKQIPVPDIMIARHRERWDCLRSNINCQEAFQPLSYILELRGT